MAQVNAGAINPSAATSSGNAYLGLVFGPMLKHYTYDGLGRLVRCQSPFPNVQEAVDGQVRSERYDYDGIRAGRARPREGYHHSEEYHTWVLKTIEEASSARSTCR